MTETTLDVQPRKSEDVLDGPEALLMAAIFGVDHWLPIYIPADEVKDGESPIDHIAVFSATANSGREVRTLGAVLTDETVTAWLASEHLAGTAIVETRFMEDGVEAVNSFILLDMEDWDEVTAHAPGDILSAVRRLPDGVRETL